MKRLLAVAVFIIACGAASAAQAQVVAAWYPAAAMVAPPPVMIAPPVPVVGYYAAPVVRFTPGRYFGPARVAPLPRRYSYRERVQVRGPYYRGGYRVRAW
ncbi:MAG TPA: hypothetical protein VF278_08175 [Pirellulales bacterium]